MALTGALTGAKGGSGDNTALFFSKFGGEVLRVWPQHYIMEGKIRSQSLTEAKETKDRWAGSVNSSDYARGTNLIADTGGATAPVGAGLKFNEFITRLDLPREVHDTLPEIDYLMSPAGDQDRARFADAFTEAIGMAMDLRALSTLIQTASMPHPDVMPTTHPYITKTIAGDTSHANFSVGSGSVSDSMCGLNVNASLTASATGTTIEDELFKHAEYLNYLGVNIEQCYSVMSPSYVMRVFKEQGQRVSIGYTSAGSAVAHPTMGANGNGFGPRMVKHEGTGITLLSCRHFPALGTAINGAFAPSATLGSKYAPGSTITDTVFGINGFAPANTGALEINAAADNPDDWNNAAKKVITVYNNTRMITFHPRAIKRNILKGFQFGTDQKLELLNGWLLVAYLVCGYGPLDPTAVVYSINAKP